MTFVIVIYFQKLINIFYKDDLEKLIVIFWLLNLVLPMIKPTILLTIQELKW